MTETETYPCIITDKWLSAVIAYDPVVLSVHETMDPSVIVRPALELSVNDEYQIRAYFCLNDADGNEVNPDCVTFFEGDNFQDVLKNDLATTSPGLLSRWQNMQQLHNPSLNEHQSVAAILKELSKYVSTQYRIASAELSATPECDEYFAAHAKVSMTHLGLGKTRTLMFERDCEYDLYDKYFGYVPDVEVGVNQFKT